MGTDIADNSSIIINYPKKPVEEKKIESLKKAAEEYIKENKILRFTVYSEELEEKEMIKISIHIEYKASLNQNKSLQEYNPIYNYLLELSTKLEKINGIKFEININYPPGGNDAGKTLIIKIPSKMLEIEENKEKVNEFLDEVKRIYDEVEALIKKENEENSKTMTKTTVKKGHKVGLSI
ncbi:MAG: hypothetical protein ACP5LH_01215 [Candidatus Micrarchaeia archaeon]